VSLREWALAIGVGLLLVGGLAVLRHRMSHSRGSHREILAGDVGVYDALARLVLGSLFRSIASEVASAAGPGARVLDVGCGPGHLAIRLAREADLRVTGLDLDPRMIERARGQARRAMAGGQQLPDFIVGDATALPFPDAAFDLVVSTLSMHHWAEPAQGLAEVGRVLRPGGRALVWDVRPNLTRFHGEVPDSPQRVTPPALDLDLVVALKIRGLGRSSRRPASDSLVRSRTGTLATCLDSPVGAE
jgi:SAM-dependent methyltransferase